VSISHRNGAAAALMGRRPGGAMEGKGSSRGVSGGERGHSSLSDILVVRVAGGTDHFVSVAGRYRHSCLGAPLPYLLRCKQPIRGDDDDGDDNGGKGDGGGGAGSGPAAPPLPRKAASKAGKNVDGKGNKNESVSDTKATPLSLPKEVWRLVDHLYAHGMQVGENFVFVFLYCFCFCSCFRFRFSIITCLVFATKQSLSIPPFLFHPFIFFHLFIVSSFRFFIVSSRMQTRGIVANSLADSTSSSPGVRYVTRCLDTGMAFDAPKTTTTSVEGDDNTTTTTTTTTTVAFTAHDMAATLLLLLANLSEPVLASSVCASYAPPAATTRTKPSFVAGFSAANDDSASLQTAALDDFCRRTLRRMKPAKYNLLVYVIAFAKTVLTPTNVKTNGVTVDALAPVLARVLCHVRLLGGGERRESNHVSIIKHLLTSPDFA
jgi:hypothetical protein